MEKDNWLYKVFLLTFFLALLFTSITSFMSENFNNIVLLIILIIVMGVGILFDMIGVSVLTSKESSFHSMASKKIKGAKESIGLIKNSVRISSICNDVIGDICGIISGGLGTVLTINMCNLLDLNLGITTMLVTAVISSLTVGCKAIGKRIANKHCDNIVYKVGKILNFCKIKLK